MVTPNSRTDNAMALNIRNAEVEQHAAELAELTGVSKTAAVGEAVAQQLARLRADRAGRSLVDELDAIAGRCASLPVLDDRSADEIVGYDDNGLPT